MKSLLPLSVSLFALAMAGCGEKSDELPVDGRDFDGVGYSEPAPYTGRVIDGYLRNARVWLDIDGDSQYSPGPLTVVLESGAEVVLPEGEPTAMSGRLPDSWQVSFLCRTTRRWRPTAPMEPSGS